MTIVHRAHRSNNDAYVRRTIAELHVFTDWLTAKSVQGQIGEFGIPNDRGAVEQGQWNNLLNEYYNECRARGLHTQQFCAGKGSWIGASPYVMAFLRNPNSTNGQTISVAAAGSVITQAHRASSRGVNVWGTEFDMHSAGFNRADDQSWHGWLHDTNDFTFLATQGITVCRLPIAWERYQQTLSGALNTTRLTDLDGVLTAANANGISIILDCHNYARYSFNNTDTGTQGVAMSTAGTVTGAHLGNFWTNMSTWLSGNSTRNATVIAFDIMNEPHDLVAEGAVAAPQVWESIAQTTVSAIRTAGDTRLLYVPGYNYSGAQDWTSSHPNAFITDSASNFRYEAHHYYDKAGGRNATYSSSYAVELAQAITDGY